MRPEAVLTEHHHPQVYWTGRYGSWSTCSCEWRSPIYKTARGASLAWAEHLAEASASAKPALAVVASDTDESLAER